MISDLKRLRALDIMLFVSITSSQFYIFSSGLPQPSNFLFLIFSLLSTAYTASRFIEKNFSLVYALFTLFFCYILTVNGIWSAITSDESINYFTIHVLYNFIIFHFMLRFLTNSTLSPRALCISLYAGIALMLALWALGKGGYLFQPRYNGFFNDPNQMAFWVLCACSIFFLITPYGLKSKVIFFIISILLILLTMSRSALIGSLFLLLGFFLQLSEAGGRSLIKKAITPTLVMILLAFAAVHFSKSDTAQSVMTRIMDTSVREQAEVRGYSRFIDYPEYLILGAGQGAEYRFNSNNEIHSTWAGIFFYYGIIGLSIFIGLIITCLKGLTTSQLLIASSPLIYSFSTFGARATIFWIFLAAVTYTAHSINKKNTPAFQKNDQAFNL